MIETSLSKVKIHEVIESQIPEFIGNDNPLFADFLKSYYISQEYQSGPVDLAENIDKYIRLDNLTKDVISGEVSIINLDFLIFTNIEHLVLIFFLCFLQSPQLPSILGIPWELPQPSI